MMGLPLGFASPLVMLGLLSLPVLWWLLRLIPPRPRRIEFPPTRLLFDIKPKEDTPARTPWWLRPASAGGAGDHCRRRPLWNPAPAAPRHGGRALIDDDFPRRQLGCAYRHRRYVARRGRQPRLRCAARSRPRYRLQPLPPPA
jgi:hypothetical protein